MTNDGVDRRGHAMIESSAEVSSVDDVDRNAIRKGRKAAAKMAKRIVGKRYDDVIGARPPGSRPGDQILAAAVALYDDGPIKRRDLKSAIAKLESNIRRGLPDLTVIRAPRSASSQPEHVGLMVYETRAVMENTDRIVTAENHSVVLTEARVIFISGLLPGGTRPHLFERVVERDSGRLSMSAVLLQLSAIWPTLLWMRMKQRREGRGLPVTEVITPFANGLLFGSLEKLDGLPPAGPTVVDCPPAPPGCAGHTRSSPPRWRSPARPAFALERLIVCIDPKPFHGLSRARGRVCPKTRSRTIMTSIRVRSRKWRSVIRRLGSANSQPARSTS
jgi:hypothetical protein